MTKKHSVRSVLKKVGLTVLFAAAVVFISSGVFSLFDTFSNLKKSTQDFDGITAMANRWQGAILLIFSGFVCVVWAVLILNVSRMSKSISNQKNQEKHLLTSVDNVSEKAESQEKETVYCVYCETELLENERECPNCGASKKKSRKNIEKDKK